MSRIPFARPIAAVAVLLALSVAALGAAAAESAGAPDAFPGQQPHTFQASPTATPEATGTPEAPIPAAAGQEPLPAIELVDFLLPVMLLGMLALGVTSLARRMTGR